MHMITTIFVSFLIKQTLSTEIDWDYEHMSQWSDSFSMCDNQQQSPIDIKSSQVINDDKMCNSFFDWDIQYDITTFQLTNNEHSIILKPVTESNTNINNNLPTEYHTLTSSENTIAKFPNYFKPPNSPHDQFCLHSVNFHWGLTDTTGSEHLLNGYQYPLEAQFVHFSCEHASLEATESQFVSESNITHMEAAGIDTHQLSTVSIFFDVIEDYINPAFDMFLITNENSKIIHGLNLRDLIPETIQTDGYYAYEGSLTTPPCTNIVRWFVMNATGKIGKSQIEQFRTLYLREEGSSQVSIAPNYRGIQNNVNKVYGCMGVLVSEENIEASMGINLGTLSVVEWVIILGMVVAIIILMIWSLIKLKKVHCTGTSQPNNKRVTSNSKIQVNSIDI